MIEGQRWQRARRKPAHGPRVTARARRPGAIRYPPAERHADDVPARVATGRAEGLKLVQGDAAEAGLFAQLALRGLGEVLVGIDEATGQRPAPGKWLVGPPYEQHLVAAGSGPDQHDIDGHGRRRGGVVWHGRSLAPRDYVA